MFFSCSQLICDKKNKTQRLTDLRTLFQLITQWTMCYMDEIDGIAQRICVGLKLEGEREFKYWAKWLYTNVQYSEHEY